MNFSKILLGAAMMVAAPFCKAQTVVETPMVHDPVMAYENGKYYLYCTGHGIAQMTSTDRKHWTLSREGVLPKEQIPAWTHDSVPGFENHIWSAGHHQV